MQRLEILRFCGFNFGFQTCLKPSESHPNGDLTDMKPMSLNPIENCATCSILAWKCKMTWVWLGKSDREQSLQWHKHSNLGDPWAQAHGDLALSVQFQLASLVWAWVAQSENICTPVSVLKGCYTLPVIIYVPLNPYGHFFLSVMAFSRIGRFFWTNPYLPVMTIIVTICWRRYDRLLYIHDE